MPTTGFQLVAARGLAGMDQPMLAERSGLSVTTIRNMEASKEGPITGRAANVHSVQRALEAAGVEFLSLGSPGVRLRSADNRRLTPDEIAKLNTLEDTIVASLDKLAGKDSKLLFALRRRLFTRLMHLERRTPARSELDRHLARKGYTPENTRLAHYDCHVEDRRKNGFTDAAILVEWIEQLDEIASEAAAEARQIEDKPKAPQGYDPFG